MHISKRAIRAAGFDRTGVSSLGRANMIKVVDSIDEPSQLGCRCCFVSWFVT
jgi:hypothetical protein